jgi:hypothetical protein
MILRLTDSSVRTRVEEVAGSIPVGPRFFDRGSFDVGTWEARWYCYVKHVTCIFNHWNFSLFARSSWPSLQGCRTWTGAAEGAV